MGKPNIANAVLQKGTEVEIIIAHPGVLHKLGLKKSVHYFTIKPLLTGALLEICSILETIDFEELEKLNMDGKTPLPDVLKVMSKNILASSEKLDQILAWGIYNRKVVTIWDQIKFKRLVTLINNNLDNAERVQLLNIIIQHMGAQDFLAFMVSIKGMNLMETVQTSGELSEDSTVISDSQEKKSSGNTVGKTP